MFFAMSKRLTDNDSSRCVAEMGIDIGVFFV